MIEHCPFCRSSRLVRGIELRTSFSRVPTEPATPGGLMGRGESIGDVRASACVDCGGMHWEARDRDRLARRYEKQQAGSVRLK